jgi:GAF domain-containing protein
MAMAEELTGSQFGFIGELNQAGLLDDIAISDPGWAACRMPGLTQRILPKALHNRGIFGKAIKDEQSLIANDPVSHPDRVGTPEGHPPLMAFLGVPLMQGGKTIGMIGLGNKPGGYDRADQEAAEALAVAIAESLMRKRAELAVRQAREELEQRVAARTLDLSRTVEQLQWEITERQQAEEALRESEERLRFLTSQLLTAQETERGRLSRDLHDDLGQAPRS